MQKLLLIALGLAVLVSVIWGASTLLGEKPGVRSPDTSPTTASSATLPATSQSLALSSQPVPSRPNSEKATEQGGWDAVAQQFSGEALEARLGAMTPRYDQVRGRNGYWRLARTGALVPVGEADTTAGTDRGVWWFVSPTGQRDWLNTVTTVQPFQLARDSAGAQFISRDYNGGTTESGDLKSWADKTLARVRDAGFKGLGAWCNPVFHEMDVPMTRDLNLWKWVSGEKNTVLLFSPEWEQYADVAVKAQVVPLRNNKSLVGYYLDNELEWGDGLVGPRVYFDHLAKDNPNRLEVMKVIKHVWPTVEEFNREWGLGLKSYDELAELESFPLMFGGPGGRKGNYGAYVKLLSVWMEHVAREYFRITTTLVRKYDPNHLILGVRFKNWAPEEIVRASRAFTDAQSLNYYVGDAKLDREMFDMMHRESGGQPVIITEYSFHSLDGRSGNRNTVGFAAQVLDQRARAEGYRLFTTRLARVPYVVGADWFQWADEPPSGRHFDGEDVNFGIVDVDDRAYEHMVRAVRETAARLNPLHAASGSASADNGEESDIWRESYAVKPVARVPYLSGTPTLNGELSDWPAEARVSGVRPAGTLGLERSRVPLPNVFAGWREEGLYLAFEVFDDDIQGQDPRNGGWWWTRDCVEWWISTRELDPKQSWYDGSCHQFFFVPREFPVDGASGIVGRWHRPGDAIADHLIPEPNVKLVTRVLPGKYVAEMLIPAASLNGWDPVREPRLGFNIAMRNWQHAIDYYWSAPKATQTQLRPNTWGKMYLVPRGTALLN